MHLTNLVAHPSVIQNTLGRRRLTSVNMRGNTDVSCEIEIPFSHFFL
jgi:hypothetical protein